MKRKASKIGDQGLFSNNEIASADERDAHFTPLWSAIAIVEQKFAHLKAGDLVLEPSCGNGVFLRALPDDIESYAVEIDAATAREAENNSGRKVVIGDIRSVKLPDRVDAVLGNPPWDLAILDAILERVHSMLPTGGKAGFLLPAYAFQTEGRVLRYSSKWSMAVECVPRRLWEGLIHPAVYAEFTADRKQMLTGFFLYGELASIRAIPKRYAEEMTKASGGLWFGVIEMAVKEMGGESSLQGIYDAVEGRRPTPNPFWREQIRKVAGKKLQRTERGTFRLPDAMVAA